MQSSMIPMAAFLVDLEPEPSTRCVKPIFLGLGVSFFSSSCLLLDNRLLFVGLRFEVRKILRLLVDAALLLRDRPNKPVLGLVA
jgi:hypothetical protein